MARQSWLNKKLEIRPRFLLLLLIPAVLFAVAMFRANARIEELNEQMERAQEQVLEAYEHTAELERRLAFMDTDEYIEQEARARYGLLGEGEIRFVLGSENSENTKDLLSGVKRDEEIEMTDSGLPAEQPVATPMPTMGAGS